MGLLQQLLPTLTGHWTRHAVPDMNSTVAVVTGFNSGIGFETFRILLEHGTEVIGICRSSERGDGAVADLQVEFPKAAISCKVCNLEVLSKVASLASELAASNKNINLLINNAGRFVDAAFGVTKECNGPARIINTISPAEQFGTLDWSDPKGVHLRTSGIKAYGRAKLMLLMFTYELQRRLRLAGAQVEAFAVHPGIVSTNLMDKVDFRYPFAVLTYCLNWVQGQSPLQGAQSTIFAATAAELSGKGGQYIGPQYTTNLFHSSRRFPGNPLAYDVDARARVWDETVWQLQQVVGAKVPNLPPVGTRV